MTFFARHPILEPICSLARPIYVIFQKWGCKGPKSGALPHTSIKSGVKLRYGFDTSIFQGDQKNLDDEQGKF